MFDLIIDFLFPKFCLACGKYGNDLCRKCRKELAISEQICPMCGRDSSMGWTHERCKDKNGMDGLIVIYDYQDDVMRKVIEEIKFGFNKEIIKIVLKNFRFESGVVFDCLVPVPLHFYRENWRGFNQAEEIAKVIGKRMRVSIVNALKRVKRTKQQSLIPDKKERERNVRGVFEIVNGVELRGKKILLVDDVFTTGADMRECTRVLKKAGAEVVWGVVLGH